MHTCARGGLAWVLPTALILAGYSPEADGSSISLRDGRILTGSLAKVSGLAENPGARNAADPTARPILLIDNGLCRTYVPVGQVSRINEAETETIERVRIPQRVATIGGRINRVGPIIRITPFDKFGRRVFSMMTEKGQIDVIQGITEVTPQWTKVEGLSCARPYVWDMRIATSSIPRDTLKQVLARQIDVKNIDHRFQLVRLLLQGERYGEAQEELEAIIKEFPNQEQLVPEVRALRQLHSRRLIDEVNMRRAAGQHRLAFTLLTEFPSQDVAGETLQQVRQILDEYKGLQSQGGTALASLKKHLEAISDSAIRGRCQVIYDEIVRDLNVNTLDRMAAYLQLADDPQLAPDAKFSLAASGWLLGSDDAGTNLAVTLSLAKVRNLVREYLSVATAVERGAILSKLKTEEGATPRLAARLVDHMKPSLDAPPSKKPTHHFELSVPGYDKDPDVNYFVELPPEYDPYRRYPVVITLHGAGTTPLQQLDWWAGARDEHGNRLGQATRHGYIVIAIAWAKPGQQTYGYSAREHAAVLDCVRDASRRFAIDSDRVFLSGHSMGGDAAWDIGLAHPDLWAGVIPIVAVADKYCARYWENAALVPFLVIGGELDGDKMVRNARDLDRYLIRRWDVTVVEYLGRGHEHFYDEIQRIFDWMGRRTRNFFPRSFSAVTMRGGDNFFWYLELTDMPPAGIVDPDEWPPARGVQPVRIKNAKITATGTIYVTTGAAKVTIWLSPEIVNLEKPIRATVNGRRLSAGEHARPNVEVLLEDVRTRGDRKHPFWAKIAN